MELNQIKSFLENPNPQNRMKAIVELRHYEPDVVVPLLKQRMYDQEFIIRSFVAMGLGYKRTEEGYESLLAILENDQDHNVKAEAANSLAKYGDRAIPHLIEIFKKESHWLIRQSIFAVIDELNSLDFLWELSYHGLQGDDLVVKLTAITNLEKFSHTAYEDKAVNLLFNLCIDENTSIRVRVARVLASFDHPKAKVALAELRYDSDHRVVAATLEPLMEN
jgi:HEAT repeat protein